MEPLAKRYKVSHTTTLNSGALSQTLWSRQPNLPSPIQNFKSWVMEHGSTHSLPNLDAPHGALISWLHKLVFLAKGGNGMISAAILNEPPVVEDIVIKVALTTESLAYEFLVNECLNSLRPFIPHFVYSLAIFECTYSTADQVLTQVCQQTGSERGTIMVTERVKPGETFATWGMKQRSPRLWLYHVCQVLLALEIAQDTLHFTHYDLHAQNVIMRSFQDALGDGTNPSQVYLKYCYDHKSTVLPATHLATIIDFGRSYIHHDVLKDTARTLGLPISIVYEGRTSERLHRGIDPTVYSPCWDMVRFYTTAYASAPKVVQQDPLCNLIFTIICQDYFRNVNNAPQFGTIFSPPDPSCQFQGPRDLIEFISDYDAHAEEFDWPDDAPSLYWVCDDVHGYSKVPPKTTRRSPLEHLIMEPISRMIIDIQSLCLFPHEKILLTSLSTNPASPYPDQTYAIRPMTWLREMIGRNPQVKFGIMNVAPTSGNITGVWDDVWTWMAELAKRPNVTLCTIPMPTLTGHNLEPVKAFCQNYYPEQAAAVEVYCKQISKARIPQAVIYLLHFLKTLKVYPNLHMIILCPKEYVQDLSILPLAHNNIEAVANRIADITPCLFTGLNF